MARFMDENDSNGSPSRIGHNGGPAFLQPANRSGWVAVSREMRDHWLVGFGQPVKAMDANHGSYSRSEAWIDLIMECRYEAGTVKNGGRRMTIQPGQMLGAVSWLAARWNWTPMTVRVFLDKLEKDGMLTRETPGTTKNDEISDDADVSKRNMQKGKQAAIITVCNYYEYQVPSKMEWQAPQQANNTQTTSTQQADNNNIRITREQGNKGTQEEESLGASAPASEHRQLESFDVDPEPVATEPDPTPASTALVPVATQLPLPAVQAEPRRTYAEAFEAFWKAYPRKKGKDAAKLKFLQVVKEGKKQRATIETIMVALERFREEMRGKEPQFIAHPATWLNQGRWNDEPDVEATQAAFETSSEDPKAIEQSAERKAQREDLLRKMRGEADG